MKNRYFVTLCHALICIGLSISFPACEKKPSTPPDQKTIGFSIFDMQPAFFQEMEKGTRQACADMGFQYKLHDQKLDPAQMVAGCENLIIQGIDALIISPCNPSALGPIIRKAKNQGIPVVINDIGGGGSDYDLIVISDCVGGGAMAADYIAQKLKARPNASKKVGLIYSLPSYTYALRRGDGFTQNMQQLGFEVVKICGSTVRDKGYRAAQDMLTAHPDIFAIFCENDPMAIGAVHAIHAAGKSTIDDILVVGFDGSPEAIQAIKAGQLSATIQQLPYDMGVKCVEYTDMLLNNKPLPYANLELREITVPVRIINQENIKNYYPDEK